MSKPGQQLGFDVPQNGAAKPPAPFAACCDIAMLSPLHQYQQVTGCWLLGMAIALRVCCFGGGDRGLVRCGGAIGDREAETPASLSAGDWVLAAWNRDCFAGVLFFGGDLDR